MGTFDGSVAGEPLRSPTSLSTDYAGNSFIQAVDHTIRKILDRYGNIRAKAGLTGAETEAEKTAKINAVKKPILILCTDLPQQRSASPAYGMPANWQRKRDAI